MSSSEEEFVFGDEEEKAPVAVKSKKKRAIAIADEGDDDASAYKQKQPKRARRKVVPEQNDDDDDDDDDEEMSYKNEDHSEDAEEQEEDFEDEAPKKKKTPPKKIKIKLKKKEPKPDGPVSSSSPKKPASRDKTSKQRELKQLDKTERLQYAMQSFLWWNAPVPPAGCQWSTMEHAGVSFAPPYERHNVRMIYDGEPVTLTTEQEEAATLFASTDPDGMHLGNPKTASIYIKNFFADFKVLLGKGHIIKKFEKCDFEPIRRHLNEQRIIRKAVTDAERAAAKDDRNNALFQFGFAIVDGHLERVGNYNMEPPAAFKGRGEHPKMGKLKQRVSPEQVSLNLSEDAAIPACSVPGRAWGDIRHDPKGQWLATWKENINNQSKYMQLAAQSSFKGKSDRSKYNKAAVLCEKIIHIRKSYRKDLKSKDSLTRQLSTAVWVIDRLALRVGGEKDTDEEADTVGCCSLRIEHLHFDPDEEGGDNQEIELEFLGKDSMLYKQTIDFGAAMYNDDGGMGKQVYKNFKDFCKRKKPTDEVFQDLNPTILNNHLKQFMDGLSAKVFRTFNASKTLQEELGKHEGSERWASLSAAEKVVEYNAANREVAILCNHQKTVSKAQETQLESIGVKLATLKKQKKQLKGILKHMSKGESDGIPTRKSFTSMKEEVDNALAKAKKMKESATSNEEKIAATEADTKAKELRRSLADAKFKKAHLWEKVPTKDQVAKRIEQWTKKIEKMELDLKHRDDNKDVALGTSKINYMDPRISVAWCKRNEVPIEKIFSKTLRDKFNWAMAVEHRWEFNAKIGSE